MGWKGCSVLIATTVVAFLWWKKRRAYRRTYVSRNDDPVCAGPSPDPTDRLALMSEQTVPDAYDFAAAEVALRAELERNVKFYNINAMVQALTPPEPPFSYDVERTDAITKFNAMPEESRRLLTAAQAIAIYLYSTNYFFRDFNRVLRTESLEHERVRWRKFDFLLSTGLHALSTANSPARMPARLIRYMRLDDSTLREHEARYQSALQTCTIMTMQGYFSTSDQVDGAGAFKDGANVCFIIKSRGNTTMAAPIAALSKFPKEGEWLVPYGAVLNVDHVSNNGGQVTVICSVSSLFDLKLLLATPLETYVGASKKQEQRGNFRAAVVLLKGAIKIGNLKLRRTNDAELAQNVARWQVHALELEGQAGQLRTLAADRPGS